LANYLEKRVMNPITRLLLLCIAVICFLPVPLLAAADSFAAGDSIRVEVEREKRFTQRALEDLVAFRNFAEEDISQLERQLSAITPLEPSRRDQDISDLVDWYYRYYDWLTGEEEAAESDLARLSAPGALPGMGELHFKSMADKVTELSRQLDEKVKGYQAEGNRLAAILDRRRLLQAQFSDLEAQLAWLARGESEKSRRPHKKVVKDERQLRAEIRVVQTELLSLPDVDEDILKHFVVLSEQGRWEGEWLALSVEEYDALHEVALILPDGDIGDMVKACRRLIRTYNRGLGRLTRMGGELDRKYSRLSPAGTIREMDRSRDLNDLYDRLRQRYNDRKEELKVRIGAWEAEVAELKSLQR
jgi:hypothetical protein